MNDLPSVTHSQRRHARWLAWAAVVLGVVLLLVFGLRAWRQIEFNGRVASGEVRVASLRGWMTFPYIERVYGVPQREIRLALGLSAQGHDDRSLRDWGEEAGLDPLTYRGVVESLIAQHAASAGAAR